MARSSITITSHIGQRSSNQVTRTSSNDSSIAGDLAVPSVQESYPPRLLVSYGSRTHTRNENIAKKTSSQVELNN